jgi:hypothetical protein
MIGLSPDGLLLLLGRVDYDPCPAWSRLTFHPQAHSKHHGILPKLMLCAQMIMMQSR